MLGFLHGSTPTSSLMSPALVGGSFTTSAIWEAHYFVRTLNWLLVGRLSSSQCASFNKANSIFQMRYLSKWLVLIHTGKNIYSFYDQELTMADCMCANTGYNITFKKTNSQLTNSKLVTKPEFFYYWYTFANWIIKSSDCYLLPVHTHT